MSTVVLRRRRRGVQAVLQVISVQYGDNASMDDDTMKRQAESVMRKLFQENRFGRFCEDAAIVHAKNTVDETLPNGRFIYQIGYQISLRFGNVLPNRNPIR